MAGWKIVNVDGVVGSGDGVFVVAGRVTESGDGFSGWLGGVLDWRGGAATAFTIHSRAAIPLGDPYAPFTAIRTQSQVGGGFRMSVALEDNLFSDSSSSSASLHRASSSTADSSNSENQQLVSPTVQLPIVGWIPWLECQGRRLGVGLPMKLVVLCCVGSGGSGSGVLIFVFILAGSEGSQGTTDSYSCNMESSQSKRSASFSEQTSQPLSEKDMEELQSTLPPDKKLKAGREEEEQDALTWWGKNGQRYVILNRMARDILAIPLSTVASESAFSTGGRTLDPFRSSLTPKMVQALLCTQDWLRAKEVPIVDVEENLKELEEIEKEVQRGESNDVDDEVVFVDSLV
uniref:HAT C-terminal dimerisation domain-containing protein n=1 Tax=Chenopodium quinoa TaxID=63459 RepID=A0A803L456_CHEQI